MQNHPKFGLTLFNHLSSHLGDHIDGKNFIPSINMSRF